MCIKHIFLTFPCSIFMCRRLAQFCQYVWKIMSRWKHAEFHIRAVLLIVMHFHLYFPFQKSIGVLTAATGATLVVRARRTEMSTLVRAEVPHSPGTTVNLSPLHKEDLEPTRKHRLLISNYPSNHLMLALHFALFMT